jgi:diaminopimelate epimerase
MTIDLTVMHGCQNRFAIVDEGVSPIPDLCKGALVLAIATRLDIHGVLFLSAHGGPRMRIFDRDGTEATMCGNGIRCAARYFRDHGCVTGSHFTIDTLDGPKPVYLENRWVTVNMGRARGYRWLAEDRQFAFTGIPHLVVLTGGISFDAARAEGRRLRYDRALGATLGYPDGVHVNFVQVSEDGRLDVLTYEAGVEDVTPACGTGSTAAAYVCVRIGRTSFPVNVRLLGGELMIDARGDSMTMRGPAEYMRPFALEWSATGLESVPGRAKIQESDCLSRDTCGRATSLVQGRGGAPSNPLVMGTNKHQAQDLQ